MTSYLTSFFSSPDNNKTYRIIFLGDSGVGKTSIIRKFFHPDISYNPTSTIFVDQYTYLHNNRKISFIDTAGQERFDALTPSYLRNPSLVILVFDIKEADSFRNLIHKWISEVEIANPDQELHYFVVANKVDLLNNAKESMRISDPYEICHQKKIPFHLSSAKDVNLIKNLFQAVCDKMEEIIEEDEAKEAHEKAFTTRASHLLESIGNTVKRPFQRPDVINREESIEDYVQELIGKTEKNQHIITAEEMKKKLEETSQNGEQHVYPIGCCLG